MSDRTKLGSDPVPTTTYVHGAERMVTAARLVRDGLFVRFADQREGRILFADLKLGDTPRHVTIPRPHLVEVHLVDGSVEEIPWDFARHFVDDAYRRRSERAGARGRHLFGQRLRALRSQKGVTQKVLAERAGVTRVTIARIEAGEQLPRYRTLVGLAHGLEIPVRRFFSE